MRHKLVLIFAVFAVLSILIFSVLCVSAQPRNFIIAYGFQDSDISYIATHFDLAITYLEKAPQVGQMKLVNPSLKVLYYRDPIAYFGDNQEWYAKDSSGNKLINKDWNWPLADITKPEYRTWLANTIKSELDANPMFDGVFLDDIWPEATWGTFNGTVPQYLIDAWHESMRSFLWEIKQAVGREKLLIINTSLTWTLYSFLVDGQLYEFFGNRGNEIECARQVTNMGKIFLAGTGGGILTKDTSKPKYTVTGEIDTASKTGSIGIEEIVPPQSPPTSAPTVTISATGNILTWSSTDAKDIVLDGKSVSLSGSLAVTPTVTTTYTAIAWGEGGRASASIKITVQPPPCAYTYSAWGACQSDSTQTRIVVSSLPQGCVGTPVLSQPCTYVPPSSTVEPPALGSPKDKAVDIPTDVAILVYEIQGLSYWIQIATDSGFSNLIVDKALTWPYKMSGLPISTQLWYRVRAADRAGNISDWSEIRSFTTGTSVTPPPPPPPPPPGPPPPSSSTTFQEPIWSEPAGFKMNKKIYTLSDVPAPAQGASYTDPIFGTKITKVLSAEADPKPSMWYHGWVRHDTESPDGTKWLTKRSVSPEYFVVSSTAPYQIIAASPYEISDYWDPDQRWPKDSSDFTWATYAAKFAKWDFKNKTIIDVRDFKQDFPELVKADGTSSISRVYAKEGGNPSLDDRYWAWLVRCIDGTSDWIDSFIVYDRETNTIVSRLKNTDPKFKISQAFIGMSPLGNYVLLDTYSYSTQQVAIYPRDFSSMRIIETGVTVHAFAGVGLDFDDRSKEVMVWVAEHPQYKGEFWVVMCDLQTGEKFWLTSIGKSPEFNASGVYPGWAVISCNHEPGVEPTSWSDGEILLVQLTRKGHPKIYRVAQSHLHHKTHGDDLFAKPNRSGTKIFFRSTWGSASYADGGAVSGYVIDLPENWEQAILGAYRYVINDSNFYELPPMTRPEKGVPYKDIYGLEVVRITDSIKDFNNPNLFPYVSTGYVKHISESVPDAEGKTKLILESYTGTGWWVVEGQSPWSILRSVPIPFEFQGNSQGSSDARWSTTNPDELFFLAGPILYSYSVKEDRRSIVRDFSADFPGLTPGGIGMMEEGVQSDDQTTWAFAWWYKSAQTHLFTYSQKEDRIIAKLPFKAGQEGLTFPINQSFFDKGIWFLDRSTGATGDVDSVSMSPQNYVLSGIPPLWIYNKDFTQTRVIGTHGHVAIGYSAEMRETACWVGEYFGPDGYTSLGPWLWMGDLETGEVHPLAPVGSEAYHVDMSNHATPGWAVVSVFWPMYEEGVPYTRSRWSDGTIMMVEVSNRIKKPTMQDHTKVWLLANARLIFDSYGTVPFAKFGRNNNIHFGTRFWHASREIDPATGKKYPYDVHEIRLPKNWFNDLSWP